MVTLTLKEGVGQCASLLLCVHLARLLNNLSLLMNHTKNSTSFLNSKMDAAGTAMHCLAQDR